MYENIEEEDETLTKTEIQKKPKMRQKKRKKVLEYNPNHVSLLNLSFVISLNITQYV